MLYLHFFSSTKWTEDQRTFLDNDFAIEEIDSYSFNIYNQRLKELEGAFTIQRPTIEGAQPPPPNADTANTANTVQMDQNQFITNPMPSTTTTADSEAEALPSPSALMRQKTREIYPIAGDLIVPTLVSSLVSGSNLINPAFQSPTTEQVPRQRLTPKLILASPPREQKGLEEQLAMDMLQEQKDTREKLMSLRTLEEWEKTTNRMSQRRTRTTGVPEQQEELQEDMCLGLYNALSLQRYSTGEYLYRSEQWLRGMHILTSGTAIVETPDPTATPMQQVGDEVEPIPYRMINAQVLDSLSGHCISRGSMVAGKNGCSTMYLDGQVGQKILQLGAFRGGSGGGSGGSGCEDAAKSLHFS